MTRDQAIEKVAEILITLEPLREESMVVCEAWDSLKEKVIPALEVTKEDQHEFFMYLKELFHSKVSLEDLQQRVRFRYGPADERIRAIRAAQDATARLRRYSREAGVAP